MIDYEEARRIAAEGLASGAFIAPTAPPISRIRPVRAKRPNPPKTGDMSVVCRWCGHGKKGYGRCEACGKKSNSWSAKRSEAR